MSGHNVTTRIRDYMHNRRRVRGYVEVWCETCRTTSGPWTEDEADAWRSGHDSAVRASERIPALSAPVLPEETT